MSRPLLLICLLFGVSSAAQTSEGPPTPGSDAPSQSETTVDGPSESEPSSFHRAGRTPAWLPRGVFLGTYLRDGAVTPEPRIQWQVTFFEDRQDALVFVLEGGPGYALVVPEALEGTNIRVNSLYENTVMAGVGYRNQARDGWHWGFQVTGGPLWYGAHLTNVDDEHYTVGLVEGRVHIGYAFGPVVLGVAGGYGEPFSYSKHSVARLMLGGVLLGFFADWR